MSENAASEGRLRGRTDRDANEDSGVTPNDEIREGGGRNSSNMGKGRGGDGRRKRGNLRGRGEGKRKRKGRGDGQCDFGPGWPAGPPPIGHAAWADPSKWGPPIEFWGTMGPPPPGHPAWWQALGVPFPPDHPAWSTMGPMGSVGPWMGMVDHPVRPPINPPPFLHPRGRPGAQPPQPPPPPLPPKSLPEGDVEQITGAENDEGLAVPTPEEATSESRVTEVVDNKGTVSSIPSEPPEDKTKNSKNATPKADRTLPVVIQRRCRTPLMTLTGSYCPLLPDVLSVELYSETALGRDGGGATLMNQLEGLKRCNSEPTDMVVADEVSSSPTTTPIPIEGEENQGPKETEAVPEENGSHNLKEDLDNGTAHEESGGDDEDDLYGDLFINDGERNEGGQRDVKGSTYGGDNGQGDRDDEAQNSNAATLGGPAFEIEPNTIRAAMNALCALERTVMMPSLVPETDELENALGLLSVPLAVIGV